MLHQTCHEPDGGINERSARAVRSGPKAVKLRGTQGSGLYRFEVENDLAEIGELVQGLRSVLSSHGLSETSMKRTVLCIEEVVTNTIEHGFTNQDKEHKVVVSLAVESDALIFDVVDDGEAFDATEAHGLPEDGLPPEARHTGGLGLFLTQTLMDEMDYWYFNGSNHLRLIKRKKKT